LNATATKELLAALGKNDVKRTLIERYASQALVDARQAGVLDLFQPLIGEAIATWRLACRAWEEPAVIGRTPGLPSALWQMRVGVNSSRSGDV